MFFLSDKTKYGRKVSKEAIYDNANIDNKVRKKIVEQIDYIVWANKLSKGTLNIKEVNYVKEIEILCIYLKGDELDDEVIKAIDKSIPYHTVYCIIKDNKYKLKMNYKTSSADVNADDNLHLTKYYETEWQTSEPKIIIEGINLDIVYYNIFKQISNIEIKNVTDDKTENVLISIQNSEEIIKLERKIEILRKKRSKEKQDSEQQKINVEIKKILNKISELK